MSRIHEALKKAEKERAEGVATIGSEIPLSIDPNISSLTREEGSVQKDTLPNANSRAEMDARTHGYLRFTDLRDRCQHPVWEPNAALNVFDPACSNPHGAEQFRTLRSRLYQLRSAQPLKKILVTSAVPMEGKTFVAQNLARAIVRQPDQRALIIDADLRLPRMHVALGAPLAPGLSEYLRREADEVGVVQYGTESNLCFIPGGKEIDDASELLSNGRLKMLLERLAPIFEWIIIDSPPCLPVADANIIANQCDGVLLIVRAGFTPAETALRARQELQSHPLLGVVLNAVRNERKYGFYNSPYHNYGNYTSKAKGGIAD
ncbi:MAG TPA: CpsD/CapB family tyrosine-protein kinase [Candidatus Acidoferrum sp.]|nr:CpsD/CapB family tyrosine-protein kinase [Candidatus Acidoferrum sp.]